jgi:hypothetical protein
MCNNPSCNCAKGLINKNINEQKRREELEGEKSARTPGDPQYDGLMSSSRSNMASMFQIGRSIDDLLRPEDRQGGEAKEEDKDSATDNYKAFDRHVQFLNGL